MRNFIKSNLGFTDPAFDSVDYANFFFDLKTGKEILIEPSIFKLKIKDSYSIADFSKFDPETLGTTKEALFESSYHSFKNKLK